MWCVPKTSTTFPLNDAINHRPVDDAILVLDLLAGCGRRDEDLFVCHCMQLPTAAAAAIRVVDVQKRVSVHVGLAGESAAAVGVHVGLKHAITGGAGSAGSLDDHLALEGSFHRNHRCRRLLLCHVAEDGSGSGVRDGALLPRIAGKICSADDLWEGSGLPASVRAPGLVELGVGLFGMSGHVIFASKALGAVWAAKFSISSVTHTKIKQT